MTCGGVRFNGFRSGCELRTYGCSIVCVLISGSVYRIGSGAHCRHMAPPGVFSDRISGLLQVFLDALGLGRFRRIAIVRLRILAFDSAWLDSGSFPPYR